MRIKTASWILILILSVSVSSTLEAQDTTDFLITWTQIQTNITEYIIYRSTDPDTNNLAEIGRASGSETSFLDRDREKGIRYYYAVKAVNNEGLRSDFSNFVSGMTIPQDPAQWMNDLCHITSIDISGGGIYDINWATDSDTRGFIQYGLIDTLDSVSDWDNNYATTHTNSLSGLLMPNEYILRAVSFDANNNMTISLIDTLSVDPDDPISPTAPLLSIFPVPYHPAMGTLSLVNLPEGGSVIILNENGHEVWNHDIGTDTATTWDGRNNQGSPVMSGVYYVVTRDSSGKVFNKRPIIIVN
jgi:hypothetical protein